MPTIGLYFRGLTQSELNALRGRLNELAASYGYLALRGPTTGQGNLAAMLVGLDKGEMAIIRLTDERVFKAWAYLDILEADNERAACIAAALRDALERQRIA